MISIYLKTKQKLFALFPSLRAQTSRQFLRYSLLGFAGLAIDFVAFWILVGVTDSPVISTLISSFVGMLTNYFLNARLNFNQDADITGAAKFIAVGTLGLAVSGLLIGALTQAEVAPLLAKAISFPPIVFLQFSLNRSWTFR